MAKRKDADLRELAILALVAGMIIMAGCSGGKRAAAPAKSEGAAVSTEARGTVTIEHCFT